MDEEIIREYPQIIIFGDVERYDFLRKINKACYDKIIRDEKKIPYDVILYPCQDGAAFCHLKNNRIVLEKSLKDYSQVDTFYWPISSKNDNGLYSWRFLCDHQKMDSNAWAALLNEEPVCKWILVDAYPWGSLKLADIAQQVECSMYRGNKYIPGAIVLLYGEEHFGATDISSPKKARGDAGQYYTQMVALPVVTYNLQEFSILNLQNLLAQEDDFLDRFLHIHEHQVQLRKKWVHGQHPIVISSYDWSIRLNKMFAYSPLMQKQGYQAVWKQEVDRFLGEEVYKKLSNEIADELGFCISREEVTDFCKSLDKYFVLKMDKLFSKSPTRYIRSEFELRSEEIDHIGIPLKQAMIDFADKYIVEKKHEFICKKYDACIEQIGKMRERYRGR